MPLKVRKNQSNNPPENCPLAECLPLIEGAWTPGVIWYLSGGPRRFNELKVDLPGVSAKVLSTRLRDLEAKGVVVRKVMPTSPPSVEYSLSDLGRELIPILEAIISVSKRLKKRKAAEQNQQQLACEVMEAT
ncbi:winged helix-turn-helix transcriptional regulator [Thalassospira australica]|uniref:winged helix-turn-helix transcriptional regulator n=1 Tax=Thalassospira australica TaxID=1528106 RepID=UPI00068B6487|nr:helix-turn-helix domain-containing protein [Thalassospira australica]